MKRSNGVDICHPGLSNLTLENNYLFENVTNVVAPQLKNLTVRWQGLHLISASELVSLRFEGLQSEWLKFSSYELCSLENVDLCITEDFSYKPDKPDAHTIFDLLQQLHSVKYLTLNMETFELLSPLMELISYQPSPFVNLKSLKVYPHDYWVEEPQTIRAEVKKYLLDGSPSATFRKVSRKEMRELMYVKSALKRMAEFREMLKHEKANIKTNIAHMHEQDKMQISKRDQIDICWKDLSAQIEHGKSKTSGIISQLCRIEQLLKKLPESKRAQIEKSFCRLCMEADTVINYIIDCVKIQSEEKQSRLSIYYHDLAMAVKTSF